MSPTGNTRGLTLLLEEYFSSGDERLVETLRQIHSPKYLSTFAQRWRTDPRPWARQQMFRYLEWPLNCPGHQPVVKRLFKQAEENRDDELMALFLVAFDRQVRRKRSTQWRWDRELREAYEMEALTTPRDVIPLSSEHRGRNPATGIIITVPVRLPPGAKLFTYKTRFYLRRRVWRYFRRLGFQQPDKYPATIAQALVRYQDDDLAKGENILDSWSLVHICFGKHDALQFDDRCCKVKAGRNLAELSPAPMCLEAWQKPAAAEILFRLIWQAKSRLVRVWAMQLLCREHREYGGTLDDLLRLLDHEDTEVQQLGVKLLEGMAGVETLPVDFWLRLLHVRNPEVLVLLCDLMAQKIAGERLNLQQCVELACAQATPVARLGIKFLKNRAIRTPADRQIIAGLANAKCAATAGELTDWALGILGAKENYLGDQVIAFFDSLLPEMRKHAWVWLLKDSPAYDDPFLWSRLAETPFDDLRLHLVDHLEKRVKITDASQLTALWCTVLLGVHRGGRQKAKAVRQIGEAIQKEPARAESLLPVLAVAIRSVRAPEARAGLAAVVSAVEARPDLAETVKRHLPELQVG